jgi:predicted phosphoribosyltransferase
MKTVFRDRADAGKKLAEMVRQAVHEPDALVLALPRGGVPVGFEVAQALAAELDVFLVRKLGLPGQEELAIGAIASGGIRVLNDELVAELQVSRRLIDQISEREAQELERREELYREGRPEVPIRDRTVIVVDDGLATGASMKAAARAVRMHCPKRVLVAVPVAARQTCDQLLSDADSVICTFTPRVFRAVGIWYEDFAQTTDEEVTRLLKLARQQEALRGSGSPGHALP